MKLETNKQVKIEEAVAAEVEKRLRALNIGAQKVAQVQQAPSEVCDICNGPYNTVHCFATPQQIEDIKFLNQNNPYSNTYNPGWKNHPNFAWKDQRGNVQQQAQGQYQNQYQQQQQQVPKKADWEIAIEKMAAQNMQFEEETRNNQKNTTASLRNLEVQLGQIAQQLASSRTPGSLPSETVQNPRGQENVNTVTTTEKKAAKKKKNYIIERAD